MYVIQHCFICRPSDSSVSEDAGIEPRTLATLALAVGRSNHSHPYKSFLSLHNPLTPETRTDLVVFTNNFLRNTIKRAKIYLPIFMLRKAT